MTNDNIPPGDPAFHSWVGPFAANVAANAVAWGVDPDVVTALTAGVTDWNTKYPAHRTAQRSATGAAKAKTQTRDGIELIARPLIQALQSNTKVTDTQRKVLNINVRSKSRTPAAVPTTAPLVTVGTSQRLRHVIAYEDMNLTSSGKPPGVSYCQIWAKIGGPAPVDESELVHLGSPSKSPYVQDFPATQAGLTVWYWAHWVNTRGQFGPWSVQVSATIPG